MKPRLVVFDIAGTTLNDTANSVNDSFRGALKIHGISATQVEINAVMGYKKKTAIQTILTSLPNQESSPELVEQIHDSFLELINEYYRSSPDIAEIEGASQLFGELKGAGIKVALDTGFSRSTTDIILERTGWLQNGLIDASKASDEVKDGRPHPFMIQALMADLNISKSSSVVKVGDTPSDLMEGENAQCGLTVGVLYGTHTRSQLKDFHHDYLIEDITELKTLIGL